MRYHQSDATFKKYQAIIILKEWFLIFWFDTAKLALRKVGLKMLPFIICLLIKKSKEGHILCRLVHNGLKILLKQFLTLMPLHFYVKIDSKEVWKLKQYLHILANFEQGKCYKIGTKSSFFCKLCHSVLL